MMNHTCEWMHGWLSGPMLMWTVISISVAVLLFAGVNEMTKKKS